MYTFLVLGLVPGTNIQITFELWLQMLGVVVLLLCLYWLLVNRVRIHQAIAFNELVLVRVPPLHATRLHH